MKSHYLNVLSIAITSTCLSSSVLAQDNNDHPVTWKGDVEFGYVDRSGNTEETTVRSGFNADRENGKYRYNITLDAINTEANSDRTAERYFFSNRLGYEYTEHDYAFVYGSYDDDRFSGFDYQTTLAVGYGRRLINDEIMQWDLEVGPGYRISKVADDVTDTSDSEEVILRVASKYSWDFSETAKFTQTTDVEAGEENTISRAETALTLKVIGSVALKLSYTIRYTEEVPNDTAHADKETAVTVSYSF